MALRALTPSGAAYCSDCGADAPSDRDACASCGRAFEGVLEAVRCMFCGAILFRDAPECYHCGRKLAGVEPGSERYVHEVVATAQEAPHQPAPVPSPAPPAARPATAVPGVGDMPVIQLSEPFRRVMTDRRRRVEMMDALVSRARRRIRMLEASTNPVEIREREELKRQVEEILVERDDIVKIEEAIMEMERIYRGVLQMQQSQLREREESLKARMEAFQRELERREREMEEIKERERDLGRREDEFRALLDRLHERERDIGAQEDRAREAMRDLEARASHLGALEQEIKRRGESLAKTGGGTAEITIQPPDAELRDMKLRITDLEEQMERAVDERNKLAAEREKLSLFNDEVKTVLKALDELLGKLPDEEIKKFAKSKDFGAYEKILDTYGL